MDGGTGKLVILLGTLGLVVGFVLAVLFLVPAPHLPANARCRAGWL
jgi:hypothetical protein